MHAQTTVSTTDVPRTISYQGLLTSTDGKAYPDGQYQVTVTLYGDAQGAGAIWQDTYVTQVTGGVFNLYLGDGSRPLPGPGTMNTPLWIGTSVNGGGEMRPLTPLAASPYAFNVSDKAITGNKIADGTITAEKLDLDYISELQIDGEKISAKGTVLNLVSTPAVPLSYDEATQSVTIGRVPVQSGDEEKGASALAGGPIVWSVGGDGYDVSIPGGYNPVAGDWIGTQGAIDFLVGVSGTQVMNYQVSGAGFANIIGGDVSNTITATAVQGSIIAEGTGNSITTGDYHAISGGQSNTITGTGSHHNAIGGGEWNRIGNAAGGYNHSGIASGWDNEVYASEAVIAGGHNNTVEAYASGIVGGHDNSILLNTSMFSFLGGGLGNFIGGGNGGPADFAVIGGGQNNRITNNGAQLHHSTIGGGWDNEVAEAEAVIGGGHNNTVESYASGILGGHDNLINVGSPFSMIGGGGNNVINTGAEDATIGGGGRNVVNAPSGTIPGGAFLTTTSSYAQSAMGFMNAPRGAVAIRPTVTPTAAFDDPLFMIGNGIYNMGNPIGSNAFEVSYNGHSVVYDVNGNTNGGGRIPIEGATYTDNVIYAWGDVTAAGGINSDFGVAGVAHIAGSGIYDVTISVNDPFGNAITLNAASITATGVETTAGADDCIIVTTSPIGMIVPNQFRIKTYDASGDGCRLGDYPFMFKVTGRQ